MATNSRLIDPGTIEGWLRELQCEPRRVEDPTANWRFEMAYPSNSVHQMAVLNPKKIPRAVFIVTVANLGPEHHAAFAGFDDEQKREFNIELQEVLNRDSVEYLIQRFDPAGLVCPTGFQVQSAIFHDGLSLDAFAVRVSSVFKTEMAGVLYVQRRLGVTSTDSSEQFGFRRLGIQ
jgi:hypothetical protein